MSEYTGVWLPAPVLSMKELTPTEKIVFCAVLPLALNEPCTARNDHFAGKIGISDTSVSLNLKALDEKGFIAIDPGKERGNKREIHLYRRGFDLFKIIKDPSLTSLNTLFKIVKEPLKDGERAFLTNLNTLFKNVKEPYIYRNENKEESKSKSNSESIDAADAAALQTGSVGLAISSKKNGGKKAPPPTPSPPDDGPEYGDGRLREKCLEYHKDNPGKYTPEMYKDFLRYWCAIVREGKSYHIGKERWETEKTWGLAGRLSTWNQINQKHEPNRNANQRSTTGNSNGRSGSANDQRYGQPDYGKAFAIIDALTEPGSFD